MATLEFMCRVPGLINTKPIQPMRVRKPEWLTKSAAEFSELRQEVKKCPFRTPELASNISKCVGIRQIYQTGWIVETWQDIIIEANQQTGEHNWTTPIDQTKYDCLGYSFVSYHDSETFKHSPHYKKYKIILKLLHPWSIKIPEGYDLLMMPVPYQENDMFEMHPGIFPGSLGMMELNTIIIWKENGQSFLPAGTPICQLVLLESKKHDENLRYMNEQDVFLAKGQMMVKDSVWEKNYHKMKDDISNLKKEW